MFIFQQQITQAIADDHVATRCGGVVSDHSKPLGQYTKLVRAPDMYLGINGPKYGKSPTSTMVSGGVYKKRACDWHRHRWPMVPWSRHWAILSLCFAAFAISGSAALAFWYLWCLAADQRDWVQWPWEKPAGRLKGLFHSTDWRVGFPFAENCVENAGHQPWMCLGIIWRFP